jgi:hypothetical protein
MCAHAHGRLEQFEEAHVRPVAAIVGEFDSVIVRGRLVRPRSTSLADECRQVLILEKRPRQSG